MRAMKGLLSLASRIIVVHGVLACAAVGGQARGAEEEECDEPYEGDEEDGHEPAQGNHGFAVVGEPTEGRESDEDIGDAEVRGAASRAGSRGRWGGKQVHPSIMPMFRVGLGEWVCRFVSSAMCHGIVFRWGVGV